jgi:putative FmdB family regulatory protein
MPTYEFECDECNKRYEVICKMDETPDPYCKIDGAVMWRVFSFAGAIFKGDGWGKYK